MSTTHPHPDTAPTRPGRSPEVFPRSFWTALVTELFERGAYYSIASFVVLYLGQLGLGSYWPSTLNGVLWSLVYFLPILSGTIADQVGYRRALLVAFVLLAIGYFLMGFPVWLGGARLAQEVEPAVTAGTGVFLPVVAAILLIGMGGSVIKPCILGTVQKTAGSRATLAFAIFYMVVNIGSLFGRSVSYLVRKHFTFNFIFAVAMSCSVVAFLVVLFLYREPEGASGGRTPAQPRRSPGRILLDMLLVLRSLRFTLFLLVSSGFNFLYSQVYNVLPLYLKKVVETNPPVDLYTMANPSTIVFFQLAVTRVFGKMKPIRSIIVGTVIIGVSMVINLLPLVLRGGVRQELFESIPVGSAIIVLTVVLIAFGELFVSARTFEYIGALAPRGQEGLFLGYANLPMAIGALVGGPVGAAIFNEVMCKGATKDAAKLLVLDPRSAITGWLVLMAIGFASAASMWIFNRWMERQR
jgi:proton-dependent oligopeptide transporter, POT family